MQPFVKTTCSGVGELIQFAIVLRASSNPSVARWHERVYSAVDVGVVSPVEASEGVDDGFRPLGSRGVIEVDEPVAGDLLMERRELLCGKSCVQRLYLHYSATASAPRAIYATRRFWR